MRSSTLLVVLTLILTAVTVMVSVWWSANAWLLLFVWGGAAFLVLFDLAFSIAPRSFAVEIDIPAKGFVGHTAQATVDIRMRKGVLPDRLLARLDCAREVSPAVTAFPVVVVDAVQAHARMIAALPLTRRGRYQVHALWLQWPSRLRLLDIIMKVPANEEILVLPDISPVLSGAIQTQMLPLQNGQKDLRLRGEGSEFHQLSEFVCGMDPRSIDWKRSARKRELVVRETRAERNQQIILCVDSGRLMAEQLAGLPKLDRAINAALALCWACGLAGDLVGFYSFDSRPRLFTPATPGRSAFARLQTLCADLRYETQETNHTLGLTHLSGRLKRRSLIVIFSDFVDSITAELMIENIAVLARHHFIVYVALRDPVLTALAEPDELGLNAIAKSVAARQILQERRAVIEKLGRLGVLCLDSTPESLTVALVARYIEIKSREML